MSAYAGSRAGLDSINPLDGGTTTGSIVNDTIRGIGHAGIAYGVGKLIQKGDDRPSWNFNQVAMDSFGNALGNAAVAGLRDAEETAARNKYIQEMGQQISANAAKVVNEGAQRAMDNSMSGIAKQQREKDTNKIMEAQGRITQGNNDAQFAAEEAKRVSRSQRLAERANEMNNLYEDKSIRLQAKHDAQIAEIDATFAAAAEAGMARGEIMYEQGRRNRLQNDFTHSYDFDELQKNADYLRKLWEAPFDIGQTNAIETELTLMGNWIVGGGGFHSSITFDNQGTLTWAYGNNHEVHSFGDISGTASLGVVKGYGTSSGQLATGRAESVYGSFSVSDVVEATLGDKVGKLSRLKGFDFSLTVENGYTINENTNLREFKLEGYSIDGTIGFKAANDVKWSSKTGHLVRGF